MSKGDRIRELRKNAGLTMEELAEKIGTTKQTIGKYEKGIVTNIPSDKIEAIARVLNSSPAFIMEWPESDYTTSENIIIEKVRSNPEMNKRLVEYAKMLLLLEQEEKK